MGCHCREVKGADAHGEMVEVAPRRGVRRLGRGTGRHQIDQRGAGAQLDELGLVESALDVTAQDGAIVADRTVEIGDPQHEMVQPGDLDRTGLRGFSTLQGSYIRHCRLLSIAVDHPTAISRSRQADYCGGDWSDRDPAPRECWLRQACISLGSRTPLWFASIRSNCAAARRAARCSARWMYCSRVSAPEEEGAGLTAVELGAAACWSAWARAVAGNRDSPKRAKTTVRRISTTFS